VQISTESANITGPGCASPDVLICESIDKQRCIKALRTAQGPQFHGQSDVIKGDFHEAQEASCRSLPNRR
jgi:hypothetical protein